MHRWIGCLFFLFSLTGCVYYGDIHGKAKPLSLSDLNTPSRYPSSSKEHAPHKLISAARWWTLFHDPQLNTLIDQALAGSPDIQIAEARIRRASAIAEGAVAPMWPSLDVNGYVQRQRFSQFGLVPPPFNGRTFNIGDLSFNFNYEFDFWGKNRQRLAAAVSETCAAEADLAESRLIISAAVATTYFQLLNNLAQQKMARENLHLAQTIARIVGYRARHGMVSDVPVKTALSSAQSAQLAVEQYHQAEMLSRHQLAVLMGHNPWTTTLQTHAFVFRYHPVKLPASLPANLLAHRPDIYAAKLRAEAAAHHINAAKARFFPNINLSAFFSYQSVDLGHLFDVAAQNNAVTGAIDLPIFDAGARRAHLRVRYAEYDLAVNSYNQTLLTALRETADQAERLNTLHAELKAEDAVVQATNHNYTLFKSRYHHGIVDYIQVLEIKQLLLQYRITQLDLQTQQLQAVAFMLKALGGNDRLDGN